MPRSASTPPDERVELRVPSADLSRWRVSAGVEGLTLSAWIRKTCDESAVDQDAFDRVKKNAAEKKAASPRGAKRRAA